MTTYFQPMAGGYFKVFSRPYDKFWCCTGSGMESFTKLGDSAVYACGSDFYLEQYLSLYAEHGGIAFSLSCDFPMSEEAEIRAEKGTFCLHLRIPDWAAGEIRLNKNGTACTADVVRGHLVLLLSAGDALRLRIPVGVRLSSLPDSPDTYAFVYGGKVLSADLGTEDMRETTTGVEVSIPARRILASERIYFADARDVAMHPERYLVREGDGFRLTGGDVDYSFGLHYRRWRERYAIYFCFCSGVREAEEERRAPVDVVQPGYGQYEADAWHELREENTVSVTSDGTCRYCRPGGSFSYDLRVDETKRNVLSLRLLHADNGRRLRVTAGDEVLFDGRLNDTMHEGLYRRTFPVFAETIARCARKKCVGGEEASVIRVCFEGAQEEESARVSEFIEMFAE